MAVTDDPVALDVVLESLGKLRQAIVQEEEEVLQTKIISTGEVRRNIQSWSPAIQSELEALCRKKEALQEISEEEGKKLVQEGKAEVIPAKLVCTVKPDPTSKSGKKKIRIVGCGNYAPSDPEQDLFAAGTNAVAVRIALALAAQFGWHGLSMDIRTAFLNASMEAIRSESEGEEEDPKKKKRSLMKPPTLLVQMGFIKPGVWWEALKAVYGYRQSPRLWSDHRDHTLHRKKIRLAKGWLVLRQMISEPSMWLIVETSDVTSEETIRGLMLVYVDDLLVCGDEEAIDLVTKSIQQTWEVSEPEKIGAQKGTRFLGMELWREEGGAWKATQVAYTLDLLKRRLGEDQNSWPKRKIPASKDIDEPLEVEKTASDVKIAQKVVGELVWLSTRCRPDLSYVVAKLAAGITKWPRAVRDLAEQVWKYLANSVDHGLLFESEAGENSLNVFSDASFGDQCQGCTLVQWGSCPILWKSSRQALMSSSTAEAELIELLESVNAGEAVRVVVEEIINHECFAKAHTDSTSALSIAIGESGSWKTRHLRRRAQALRWRVTKGDWVVRHVPGAENPSDLGTKALAAEKFEKFKLKIGMTLGASQVQDGVQEKKGGEDEYVVLPAQAQKSGGEQDTKLRRALAAVVWAAQLSVSKAQEDDEEGAEKNEVSLVDFLVFWVVIPAILTIAFFLWRQKNAVVQRLEEKEALEKKQKEEKALEEKIRRQVLEDVKKMREEERESDRAAASSRAGSEGLSRRLRRNQSDESAISGVSSVTHRSESKSEVRSAACSERISEPSSSNFPQLTFPNDLVSLYVSPGGEKYHFNSKCRGLRSAVEVKQIPRCRNCGPVQAKPRVSLFGNYCGEFHTIKGHASVLGEYSKYEPCHICTGA